MKNGKDSLLNFTHQERRTKIHKRMILYLQDLAENPKFLQKISKLRKKYSISKDGEPELYKPPPEFHQDMELLAREYEIRDPLTMYLRDFILHNDLNSEWIYSPNDIIDLKEELIPTVLYSNEDNIEKLKELVKFQPVAILIDPYSSQQDILDFIKTNHRNVIGPLQKKYRNPSIKLGRVRKKNTESKKLHNFIYQQSKKHTARQIVRFVNDKFGKILDYTYVLKIIRLEKHKKDSSGY